MLSKLLLWCCIILFSGCNYKPSVSYATNEIDGNVYVDLKLNINNTQNSVYIKDALNELILNQFHSKIVHDKSKVKTIFNVALTKVSNSAIASDNDGFAKTYRTSVTIKVSYNDKASTIKNITVTNYYDYSVDSESTITEQKKEEAIKIAASKALNDIFSKIAIQNID